MQKHYVTNSTRDFWRSLFGYSRFGDVIKVFLVIFFMAGYQCLLPVSFAIATDDVSNKVAEEESDESDEDDEEDEETEDEEDDVEDEEENDSDGDGEEGDPEDEEDNDDEKNSDDGETGSEKDAVEENDEEASDVSSESGESDENTDDNGAVEEGTQLDGVSDVGPSQENDEQESSDPSAFSQESEEPDASNDKEIIDDQVSDGQVCVDDCPEISIVNSNDADVEVDIEVEADTGNNTANENGENTAEDAQLCDETLPDNECGDNTENDECPLDDGIQDQGDQLIDTTLDCAPTEDDAELIEEDVATDVKNDEAEEGDEESEESALRDTESDAEINDGEQESLSEINTGDVASVVNLLQHVNSNIVGTNWSQLIYDIRDVYDADIDLFSLFEELLKNADDTTIAQVLDIYNQNTATVTNTVTTSVNTGGNTASDNIGDADIVTGDAVSGVNIVNVVNQNLIGNNWLFAIVNVFGQWSGDLIVPGEGLLSGGDAHSVDVNITNENNANIDNTVTTSVNTGGNTASDNMGDVTIETGDAVAVTNVTEMVNTNIVASNWFFLMINNMGTWTGNVLRWNDENNMYTSVFQYLFGDPVSAVDQECNDCNTVNIHNDNTAVVSNTITTQVNTGNNIANGNSGSANIVSGDAIAWANIFNLINTNIVGSNWMFSIVNVMNEWSGDVVFAYPDLAITIDDARDAVTIGDEIHYTISYQNIGEAAAESVMVTAALPNDVMYHGDGSESKKSMTFDIGEVLPGSGGNITLVATVSDDIGPEGVVLNSSAQITTKTAEVDIENNSASDRTSAIHDLSNDNIGGLDQNFFHEWDIDPDLTLRRTSNIAGPVKTGDLVVHQIVVENTGDSPVYDIILTEEIESADGMQLVAYEWDAGYLLEGESAIIDYAVVVSGGMSPNDYRFKASAEGVDGVDDDVESNNESIMMTVAPYLSPIAIQDDANDMPKIVSEAHAYDAHATKDVPGRVEDASFWVWLIALLLYALVINWTLFPQRKRV
jgi:uncharacterized repeat protein (TIGR01451 family)